MNAMTVFALLVAVFAISVSAQGGKRRGRGVDRNGGRGGGEPSGNGFRGGAQSGGPQGGRRDGAGGAGGERPFGGVLSALFGNHSESGHGERRFGSRGGPRPNAFNALLSGGDVATWNWTLSSSGEVTQMGMAQDAESKVVVLNFDRRMEAAGLDNSAVLYDFSTAVPLTVVKVKRACYLVPMTSGLDYVAASTAVSDRNGTTIADVPAALLLNATGMELSAEDRTLLETDSENLRNFCENLPLFDTTPADAATFPADEASVPESQQVLNVLTLDSVVTLLSDDVPRPFQNSQFRNRFNFGTNNNNNRFGGRRNGGRRRDTTTTAAP